jgi:integrase
MPLKLKDPRPGKTPYYSIRGTYLGTYVNRSAGTGVAATARKVLKRIERDIESGAFSDKSGPTFHAAAAAYMKASHDNRFVAELLHHFKERPLAAIDQTAIDEAAHALYPNASPATRNRQVYTPVSAILKHVGIEFKLKRPKKTDWLREEEVYRIFDAADEINKEFASLLRVLCYTGMRRGEVLGLRWRDVHLSESYAGLGKTKNGRPRGVHLPPTAVAAIANLPRHGERVFRFHSGGHIYSLLRATFFRAGVDLGERNGFHLFRHTWATWMRRYAGLDSRGLVATDAWQDEKSASRYSHVVVSEEARKADLLPSRGMRVDSTVLEELPKQIQGVKDGR